VYWSVPRIVVVSACCGVMLVGLALVGTSFYCTVTGRTKAECHGIHLKIDEESKQTKN
jgi:hypothetical protein